MIDRLRTALAEADQSGALDRLGLAIEAIFTPDGDAGVVGAALDGYADAVRRRLSGDEGPTGVIAAINQVLFVEQGFAGDEHTYYDPRNSFITAVITRRRGIPITLSILYLEVARRLGRPMAALGLPLRFMVAWPLADGRIIVDPFDRGRIIEPGDCAEILSRIAGRAVHLSADSFRAVRPREIAARMLRNVLSIYVSGEEYENALLAIDALTSLDPAPEWARERGLVLGRLGRLQDAIECLERYLRERPAAADRDAVLLQVDGLRRERGRREGVD